MDVGSYLLEDHKHESVRDGNRTFCPECIRQYDNRLFLLAMTGYAAAICRLFARLSGQLIRYKQWIDGPWGVGRVVGWEYPNCCLEIEEPKWEGDVFPQRSRWLRFGWCGVLDEESEFVVLND